MTTLICFLLVLGVIFGWTFVLQFLLLLGILLGVGALVAALYSIGQGYR